MNTRGTTGDATPDEVLAERTGSGDRDAFAELMRRHEEMVFAVCLRTMGDREAALDAAQETFVTVWRKADRFRGESAFTTWLYRVAVNACYDLHRKAARRATDPLPETHDPIDVSAGDPFESAELRPDIEDAIASLPDEFRAAVVLSDVEGLPIAQIAEILDVPAGTVKSRVFRGRRHLAEILGNLRESP